MLYFLQIMELINKSIEIIEKWFSSIIKWELWSTLDLPWIQDAINELWISDDIIVWYKDLWEFVRTWWETYWTIFEIIFQSWIKKKYFAKAIVRNTIVDSLRDFSRRRNELQRLWIPVSHWYYSKDWMIIEDYYEHDYQFASLEDLVNIAYKLDKWWFSPRNFLTDIMCDVEWLPKYIDFWEDLGYPSQNESNVSILSLISKFPNKEKDIFNIKKRLQE